MLWSTSLPHTVLLWCLIFNFFTLGCQLHYESWWSRLNEATRTRWSVKIRDGILRPPNQTPSTFLLHLEIYLQGSLGSPTITANKSDILLAMWTKPCKTSRILQNPFVACLSTKHIANCFNKTIQFVKSAMYDLFLCGGCLFCHMMQTCKINSCILFKHYEETSSFVRSVFSERFLL